MPPRKRGIQLSSDQFASSEEKSPTRNRPRCSLRRDCKHKEKTPTGTNGSGRNVQQCESCKDYYCREDCMQLHKGPVSSSRSGLQSAWGSRGVYREGDCSASKILPVFVFVKCRNQRQRILTCLPCPCNKQVVARALSTSKLPKLPASTCSRINHDAL